MMEQGDGAEAPVVGDALVGLDEPDDIDAEFERLQQVEDSAVAEGDGGQRQAEHDNARCSVRRGWMRAPVR